MRINNKGIIRALENIIKSGSLNNADTVKITFGSAKKIGMVESYNSEKGIYLCDSFPMEEESKETIVYTKCSSLANILKNYSALGSAETELRIEKDITITDKKGKIHLPLLEEVTMLVPDDEGGVSVSVSGSEFVNVIKSATLTMSSTVDVLNGIYFGAHKEGYQVMSSDSAFGFISSCPAEIDGSIEDATFFASEGIIGASSVISSSKINLFITKKNIFINDGSMIMAVRLNPAKFPVDVFKRIMTEKDEFKILRSLEINRNILNVLDLVTIDSSNLQNSIIKIDLSTDSAVLTTQDGRGDRILDAKISSNDKESGKNMLAYSGKKFRSIIMQMPDEVLKLKCAKTVTIFQSAAKAYFLLECNVAKSK